MRLYCKLHLVTCGHCARIFVAHRRSRQYCSQSCSTHAHLTEMQAGQGKIARKRRPPGDRFWEKVRKGDACWLWQGCTDPNGYGRFNTGGRGRSVTASRMAYELTNGPVPDGLFVCHACDNPRCVRPDHLFLGTQAINMRDMLVKGRGANKTKPESFARGSRHGSVTRPERLRRADSHPHAKLTSADVVAMRAAYAAGGVTQMELASQYGIHQTVVSDIVRRRSWASVP